MIDNYEAATKGEDSVRNLCTLDQRRTDILSGKVASVRVLASFGRSIVAALVVWSLAAGAGHAEETEEAQSYGNLRLSLPYAFYNETFGISGGWVEGRIGFPQPNARLFGTFIAGDSGSLFGLVAAQNLQIPGVPRLFIDPQFSVGRYDEANTFIDGNPAFPGQRAGTNDSDKNNFVSGNVSDVFGRLRLRYLLPIGNGRDQILTDYKIRDGALVAGATGGDSLNPFKSGRSFVEVRPFARVLKVEDGGGIESELRTNGIDFIYFWDNRDFPYNPTDGNGLRLQYSRDFGLFDSSDSWSVVSAEMDAYHDFGATGWFRNRVLALSFWTADTPSWTQSGNTIRNRPPAYTGATLGGLWRLRGYPTQRFNDRSAIYYAAEMRMTPRWNPFDSLPALNERLGIEWIQIVPFGEVGRVAGRYDLKELHTDMKWSAGIGIRAWAKGFVVRADTAFSDEGIRVQMMIGQPFQF